MNKYSSQQQELEILNYAANNSDEEICACDMNANILFANTLAIASHKLSDEFRNHTIYDLQLSDFQYENWAALILDIRTKKTVRFNVKKEKEKNPIFYEIRANFTKDNHGTELIWFFAKDITEKIAQENKIKELNYVMDAVLSNIPVYLFVKDTADDLRYIYWNKAFENFSKIPSSKALGRTDYEVFPNRADAEKFRKDDLTILHKRGSIEFQEEYVDAEGVTRCVHTLKTLVASDKTLPWIMGVSWDITELKKTERELIAARLKAEQSDKLKSAFLANMSHEIRTPLNAIVGFARLLGEAAEDEERKQYSEIIDNNANLLLQLINDILDISKIEAGTLEFNETVISLNDMFHDIYEIHRTRLNEGVELIYDQNKDETALKCDRNRLLQVMTNLITNASKFTTNGEVRFGFKQGKDSILFYVKDTGMGISRQKIGDIFNRFTKLNSFIQGTGLGLSICQTIVERMKGRIWVESEEQIGSTFYFSVPYESNQSIVKEKPVKPVTKKKNSSKKKTILVAEDIDSNYFLIESIIGKDYTLLRAIDGNDAIAKFEEHHPDLILMDIKMPEKDGLEATKVIRKQSKIPIIAVTSYAYESDKAVAIKSGCNDFIPKPISADILHKTLQLYL